MFKNPTTYSGFPPLAKEQLIELLGGWEGYQLGTVGRQPSRDGSEELWLELLPRDRRRKICSGCGQVVESVHDRMERWVRDLPILGATVWLLVWRCRLACPRCGPKLESLSWLAPYSRLTRRLELEVARLCRWLPVAHVAEYIGLHRHTVKAIDKTHLRASLGEPDLSGVEVVAMDEFALHKGHRYATVFVEPRTRRVLWVCLGRTGEQIRPFFEALGAEGRRALKAVVMDMSGGFEQEVRRQCPLAEIVYDLFHIVSHYGKQVVDRVRLEEAQRVRQDQPHRQVIKGSRWLLLRNRENLAPEQKIQLAELLTANQALATVYILKEDLKELWRYVRRPAALNFWKNWHGRAMQSGIAPLRHFAHCLEGKLAGILAHCRWPFHTSLLEGINNKIKVLKRMAYGYRDHEYFFLKIRAAFPGNPP